MTKLEMLAAFAKAKKEGASSQKACYALMDAGASIKDATDACWIIETGKAAPGWATEYGLYADTSKAARAENAYHRNQE